jgi:hypothetical protein
MISLLIDTFVKRIDLLKNYTFSNKFSFKKCYESLKYTFEPFKFMINQ